MWERCQTAGLIGNKFGTRMQMRLHVNGYSWLKKLVPRDPEGHCGEGYIIIIIIILKSLFQAMPIKVRCTIAQKSAQIVGARIHVCIITKLRKHTGVAKKGLHNIYI